MLDVREPHEYAEVHAPGSRRVRRHARLPIGIEHLDDLFEDLECALSQV